MKQVVTFLKSIDLQRAASAVAATAGVASYVTLVLALTQNYGSVSPGTSHVTEVAAKHSARGEGSIKTQQADFVAKIIKAHNRNHDNTEKLAELIVHESLQADVDPLFVAAIIRSESMFKNSAVSNRGAKGLMQLMPATGKYISKREKITFRKVEDLKDPATNLKLGIAYLKYLDKKFKGNREHVLIAYNWGPGNVMQSLGGTSKPPSSSVHYARTIISAHEEWRSEFSQHALNTTANAPAHIIG